MKTARRLRARIWERFPNAGLIGVAEQLIELASHAQERSISIRTPNWRLRIGSYGGIALIVAASVAMVLLGLSGSGGEVSWAERIQAAEAGINDLVLLGAAIYFVIHL